MEDNQISLNSNIYTLKGELRKSLISKFAPKRVEGDVTLADDPNLSHWVVNDQRGGIGIENYRGELDLNSCWWSTCNLDFAKHIVPPPLDTAATLPTLPTIVNGDFETWADAATPTGWTQTGTIAREATIIHGGTYSAKITSSGTLNRDLVGWDNAFRGKLVTVKFWIYRTLGAASDANCIVDDGELSTTVAATGTDAFTEVIVHHTIGSTTASKINVKIASMDGGGTVFLDDVTIDAIGTFGKMVNHNSNMYVMAGSVLLKLNSTSGAAFLLEGIFPATITDIISTTCPEAGASTSPNLVVLLGDSTNLWYIEADGDFVETTDTTAKGKFGVDWSNKFFMITAAGQLSVEDSLAAACVFVNNGKVNDGSTIQKLILFRDSGMNPVIYCGTDKNVWVHDTGNGSTTGKFIRSGLTFPSHPNACKGMVEYNASLFVSMGLHIKKYDIDSAGAHAMPVGLDLDDGIPDEYAGEIIDLQETENGVWALVSGYENSKRPTGYVDAGGTWAQETLAYDGKVTNDFFAYEDPHGGSTWGDFLELDVTSHKCSQVSFYAEMLVATTFQIDIDVSSDGSFAGSAPTLTHVYSGTFTNDSWTKKTFTEQTVAAARIRFYAGTGAGTGLLKEFCFGSARYSTLMYNNGLGWQCRWVDTNVTSALTPGLASNVYDYRFWWGAGGTIYYITLPRNLQNPKKTSGYEYAASAVHITPWFSGGSDTLANLLKALKTFCQDLTANETITVSYRLNKATTGVTTAGDWTALVTLDSTGENGKVDTDFGSGVGVSANCIQFKFAFARVSTTTLAPDLQSYHLAYRVMLPVKYGYLAYISPLSNKSPFEISADLTTAVAAGVLVPLVWRDSTIYVLVVGFNAVTPTAQNYYADYVVEMVEL